MIKVDLITGFLGSGKTTFLKMYARYLMDQGLRIGILENDYGAVNVDMMLLQDIEGDNCGLEMVAGGCDADCHKRRFKTKLIAMGMSGYDRVLIEPSGIFDMDEFFDVLREDPLERWYEIGNVIAVVDAGLADDLSDRSSFILASQIANAGCVLLSKSQLVAQADVLNTKKVMKEALAAVSCNRNIDELIVDKSWSDFVENDYKKLLQCGYKAEKYVKKYSKDDGYQSLYFMNQSITCDEMKLLIPTLMEDSSCGRIFRVKGFIREEDGTFIQINATKEQILLEPIPNGQEIFIVIGEDLQKERIEYLTSKAKACNILKDKE